MAAAEDRAYSTSVPRLDVADLPAGSAVTVVTENNTYLFTVTDQAKLVGRLSGGQLVGERKAVAPKSLVRDVPAHFFLLDAAEATSSFTTSLVEDILVSWAQ
jgi:hypothetical protein